MKVYVVLVLLIILLSDNQIISSDIEIQNDLIANSYDWGRRRIDLPNFPAGPYEPDNNYKVIKLVNKGTSSITIYNIKIISDINGTAFEFDRNILNNIQIQPNDSLYVPVKFHPKVSGPHELIIAYDNTVSSNTQTILRGIGIVPKIKTEDVNFGLTILQDYAHPNLRKVRFTNPGASEWNFGDTLTIFDLQVKPIGNEIGTDTSWGTEGFRFNKSALNFPIKLARGEFIEFDADFVADKVPQSIASLVSVSDAETEAESKWTGSGLAQGIIVTVDSVTTCFNDTQIIKCKVYNTGSDDLSVDSIKIQPLDSQSIGVFDFVNPIDSVGFLLTAGSYKEIEIRYCPKKPTGFPIPDTLTHKAYLIAYNSSLFTPIAVSETPIIGNAIHQYCVSIVVLSKDVVLVDDTVEAMIALNPGKDIRFANINEFELVVNYNPSFLKVNENDIKIGDSLIGKFKIVEIKINDVKGEFIVKFNSKTDILNFPEGVQLLKFKFRTFYPNSNDSISTIMHQIVIDSCDCLDFYPVNATLALYGIVNWRIINLLPNWFSLNEIRPNPVANGVFIVNFSLGYKNYTELKIYDIESNTLLIPVSKVLEQGIYNIPIDVSNLPIGTYWCDIISGTYHETKMFIVK